MCITKEQEELSEEEQKFIAACYNVVIEDDSEEDAIWEKYFEDLGLNDFCNTEDDKSVDWENCFGYVK